MSIFLNALGGAGQGMAELAESNKKAWDATDARSQQSELDILKAQTVAEAAQKLKDAPLLRLQAKAQEFAQQDVPVEAAPVTTLTGKGNAADGQSLTTSGMQGNAQSILAYARSLPDSSPDKAPLLAQVQNQFAADTASSAAAVSGQTRKRTNDEAQSAAVDWARVNDLPAARDYEASLGKSLREDVRLDQTSKRDEARIAAAGAETARKEKNDQTRADIESQKLDLQNRRLEALIQQNGGGDKGNKEALSFLEGQRKDVAAEAQSVKGLLQAELKSAILPTQKAEITKKYESKLAEVDARRNQVEADFNSMRSRVGLPPVQPLVAAPAVAAASPGAPAAGGASDYSKLWK